MAVPLSLSRFITVTYPQRIGFRSWSAAAPAGVMR
jgi:hypothetical protein